MAPWPFWVDLASICIAGTGAMHYPHQLKASRSTMQGVPMQWLRNQLLTYPAQQVQPAPLALRPLLSVNNIHGDKICGYMSSQMFSNDSRRCKTFRGRTTYEGAKDQSDRRTAMSARPQAAGFTQQNVTRLGRIMRALKQSRPFSLLELQYLFVASIPRAP
jgi:hypothetical protein